ncbi:MAG: acyl carrier protein [Deltaproteobacteria bacterium]|nr:acyl carrier protein [Deltaproteobacteria bacterium]
MKDRVLKIVSQVLNVPVELLNEESSPDTVASWDSLKHMNLILALEEEFGIQFRDEQIVEILKVGLIIEAVKEFTAA